MVPGVEDVGTRLAMDDENQPSGDLVTPEELRGKLVAMRNRKSLVLHLVDLTDLQGTFLRNVRDLVSKNPVLIVGTKMDLLPRGSNVKDVADWVLQYVEDRGLSPIGVVLCSSKSGFGIRQTAGLVKKNRKGRDVVVVGAANVGKSAFTRSLLNEMSSLRSANYDIGAAQIRHKPVESEMPGTTLGVIPLEAFETGGYLYDTPGLHLEHRLIHMMRPEEVKRVVPRRPLSPYVARTPASLLVEARMGAGGEDEMSVLERISEEDEGASATYLWGGVARIDVLSCPLSTHLVFVGSNSMRIKATALAEEGGEQHREREREALGLWNAGDSAGLPEEDLEGRTVAELKDLLRGRGLPVSGRKADLVERLRGSAPAMQQAATEEEEEEEEEGELESVRARGGLVPTKEVLVRPPPGFGDSIEPVVDICVSGVPGWVVVCAKRGAQPIKMVIRTPKGVQTFLREPFPLDCLEY